MHEQHIYDWRTALLSIASFLWGGHLLQWSIPFEGVSVAKSFGALTLWVLLVFLQVMKIEKLMDERRARKLKQTPPKDEGVDN